MDIAIQQHKQKVMKRNKKQQNDVDICQSQLILVKMETKWKQKVTELGKSNGTGKK